LKLREAKLAVTALASTNQATILPIRKVTFGGLAGACSIVLVWLWNTFLPSHMMPAEVASGVTTILSFVVSYLVPPAADEKVM
jgi:hypothetical protein